MGKNTLSTTDANLKIAESDGWKWIEENHQTWFRAVWMKDNEGFLDPHGNTIEQKRANRASVLPSYTGPSGDPIRAAIARMTQEEREQLWVLLLKECGFEIEQFGRVDLYTDELGKIILASPLTLSTAYLRVKLNDPQLVIDQP